MNNISNKINGTFTISVNDREHPNMVVASGLSNVFGQSSVTSLCDTVKVYNSPTPVAIDDVGYGVASASTSNVTAVDYGVKSDEHGEYFYMKKTWTFAQGQIPGTISKLAVFSDDGTMYAAALLKDADGRLDPVRPMFAPKVDISYESKWHFKQGDNFTTGIPVYFSEAGMINVKTNMADKNDPSSYQNMDKPLSISSVELFSDAITTNDTKPTDSLGVVDKLDYSIEHIVGKFGVYGQKLNLILPKDKYISDTPIASVVVTTTRGKWQLGFEPALEKPLLSKRLISLNIPFLHGTQSEAGDFVVTGNPGALGSIFTRLLGSTYDISTRTIKYDSTGVISVESEKTVDEDTTAEPPVEAGTVITTADVPAYFGTVDAVSNAFSFVVPSDTTVNVLLGDSNNPSDYYKVAKVGTVASISTAGHLTVTVDGIEFSEETVVFTAGDNVSIKVAGETLVISNLSKATSYTTEASTSVVNAAVLLVGGLDVSTDSSFIVY